MSDISSTSEIINNLQPLASGGSLQILKNPLEGLGLDTDATRAVLGSCATTCSFAERVIHTATDFVVSNGYQPLPLLATGKRIVTGQTGAKFEKIDEDTAQKAELLHWLAGNVMNCAGCENQGSCTGMASTVLDLAVKSSVAEQRIAKISRREPVIHRTTTVVQQRGWLRRIIGI